LCRPPCVVRRRPGKGWSNGRREARCRRLAIWMPEPYQHEKLTSHYSSLEEVETWKYPAAAKA
jgi:hypothetical protein